MNFSNFNSRSSARFGDFGAIEEDANEGRNAEKGGVKLFQRYEIIKNNEQF